MESTERKERYVEELGRKKKGRETGRRKGNGKGVRGK